MTTLHFTQDSLSHLPGLSLFEADFPERITANGTLVDFEPGRPRRGFSLTRKAQGFRVQFARPCDAYRALGLLLAGDPPVDLNQDCAHESLGVMWDLSRNAVLRPEALEELFRKFALLGINSVQLYMEDVYRLSEEPFFGYGRGAYSCEELRRIDQYGRRLGIEVIPCIQTLGHLEQIMQWPAYWECRDVSGVLLVGDERTRQLIAHMLDTVAGCFASRRIHIGMDEAHGIGTGKYLRKNGWQRPFDILTSHLQLVVEMCRQRGLQPMIWSDMFFRIGSATQDYYDRDAVIPPDVAAQVPAEVELVYWDYYHADCDFYEEWIRRHRALGKEPIFAGAAWSWGRFWAYAPRWKESLNAGMRAARSQKIPQALLTVWGDDGAEFHPASVLPAVQYFAEWAYVGPPDENTLERQFPAIARGSALATYLRASELDEVPSVCGIAESSANYSKWILWHDPVLGFLNAHISSDLPGHYRKLADALSVSEADDPVHFAMRVARAVAPKAELHLKARAAWLASDGTEIRRLKDGVLPECLQAVHELWRAHRAIWHQWNKPFGWEVIERRYAGCVARLEALGRLLEQGLQTPETPIPEWEFDPLALPRNGSNTYFSSRQVVSASVLNS